MFGTSGHVLFSSAVDLVYASANKALRQLNLKTIHFQKHHILFSGPSFEVDLHFEKRL